MKRISVSRMLTQRLAESKRGLRISYDYEDMVNVMGGDNSQEPQYRINMQKDINELEFLLAQLKFFFE